MAPRSGIYGNYTDEDMIQVRNKEQKETPMSVNSPPSSFSTSPAAAWKDAGADQGPINDLAAIIEATKPEVIYTHNLADKHDTHIGVTMKVIAALRRVSEAALPKKVYGCEVWRDLDWMVDTDKSPSMSPSAKTCKWRSWASLTPRSPVESATTSPVW